MTSPPAKIRQDVAVSEKCCRSRISSHSRSGRGQGASQDAMSTKLSAPEASFDFRRFSSITGWVAVGPKAQVTVSFAGSHAVAVNGNDKDDVLASSSVSWYATVLRFLI